MADQLTVTLVGKDQLTPVLRDARQELRGFHGDTLKLGTAIGAAASVTTAALNALGSAAQAAFSALGAGIVGMNSKLEQSTIAFTTMLGSGEKAAAFLKDLQQFAAQTPFEFPDLVKASQRMLAFGFTAEQVRPTLTAVGNAVASLGGGAAEIDRVTTALGQMMAKGRVQGDEMLQLTEAGINGYRILAQALGTDVATAIDQVSKGQVQASTFIQAFIADTNARLGGMMEAQSRTFAGALSTLKDVAGQTISGAFKPFFDVISSITVSLSDIAQSETVSIWAQDLGIKLGALVPLFSQVGDWLMAQLPAAMSAAEAGAQGFVQSVQTLSATWQQFTQDAQASWDRIAPTLSSLERALTPVVQAGLAAGEAYRAALQMFADATVTVLEQLAGPLAAIEAAWTPVWQEIQIQAVHAINVVIPAVEQLGSQLRDTIVPALETVRASWESFWGQVGPTVALAWQIVQPILEGIAGLLGSAMVLALQGWKNTWDDVVGVVRAALEKISPIIGFLADKVGGFASELNAKIQDTLASIAPQAVPVAEAAGEAIRQAFVKGTAPIPQQVAAEVAKTAPAITAQTPAVTQAATTLVEQVAQTATAEARQEFPAVGQAAVQGIQAGIEGQGQGLQKSISGVLLDGLRGARDTIRARSPSQLFAEQVGEPMAEGIAAGITAGVPAVQQAMTALLGALIGPGGPTLESRWEAEFQEATGSFPGRFIGSQHARGLTDEARAQRAALINNWHAYNNLNTWLNPDQGLGAGQNIGFDTSKARTGEVFDGINATTRAMQQAIPVTKSLAKATEGLSGAIQLTYQAGSGLAQMTHSEWWGMPTITQRMQEAARAEAEVAAKGWEISKAWAAALTQGRMLVGGVLTAPGLNYAQIYGTTATQTGQSGAAPRGVRTEAWSGPSTLYQEVPRFAQGGVMPYTGLAHLERGETVTPAGRGTAHVTINYAPQFSSATQAERRQFMEAIRGDVQQIVRETV